MGYIRTEREGPSLLRLEVGGDIDAPEMEAGIERFLSAAEPLERFDMLYLVQDVRFPTLSAMRVELARLGRLWRLLPRLDRVALVANQGWIRAAAKAENALIPGVTIETFAAHEEARARSWLAG